MRLIDADALDTLLLDCRNRYSTMLDVPIARTRADEIESVRITIRKQLPTIEAEPVRHGRWIKQKDGTLDCSACRSTAPYKEDRYGEVIEAPIYPRCPYCGAIMDGGGSK